MKIKTVKSFHGLRKVTKDPEFEIQFSHYLASHYSPKELLELYSRFSAGEGQLDSFMRKAVWRAGARRFGSQVRIASAVGFRNLETFEIGDGVFIGSQAYIQGRAGGRCKIGNHVWIGPQSYFDARDLIIEDYVGWGPGAKVLGSTHTGLPAHIPIIKTDLKIKTVKVESWADIGTNAVLLPGVTVGKGSIVGAGAVVTKDVQPYSVVAGVPAQFLRWRQGYGERGKSKKYAKQK